MRIDVDYLKMVLFMLFCMALAAIVIAGVLLL